MSQRVLFPKKLTREELNSLVDRAADLIRTAVDYKFILVLLFLKRLNDVLKFEKERMKKRFAALKPYLLKGVVKENPNGYLSLGNTSGLNLKQRRDLKALVDAENRDRDALYTEVAKALNISPAQKERVARIFAEKWMKSLR